MNTYLTRYQYGDYRRQSQQPPRRKASSDYSHLRSCDLEAMGRLPRIEVEDAIQLIPVYIKEQRYMEARIRLYQLAQFAFDYIKIPPSQSSTTRALIKTFQLPRRRFNTDWFSKNRRKISNLIDLLTNPLRQDGEGELSVGPFSLRNPINLASDKVEELVEAVEKSLRFCTNDLAPSFPSAIYGNVTLAENIGGHNTLAWYNIRKDDITLKYVARSRDEFIHTFIHELGHRYFRKNLSQDKKSLWTQYHSTCERLSGNFTIAEFFGEPVAYGLKKRTRWTLEATPSAGAVEMVLYSQPDSKTVELKTPDDKSLLVDAKWVKKLLKSKVGVFPTVYAQTNLEEHFCEAIAHKALGKLHPVALEAFNSIIVDGREYSPEESKFTKEVAPVLEDPTQPSTNQPTPETSETDTLPTRDALDLKASGLASQMGLGYQSGRTYGLMIYTNDSSGSTHAYVFMDYGTGNLYIPRNFKSANKKVNIANIMDDDIRGLISFERMSSLRPKWRTMNTISKGTQSGSVGDMADQIPQPDTSSSFESTVEEVVSATTTFAQDVGLVVDEKRKFIRLIYENPQGTRHAYLWVEKVSGNVYRPQSNNYPERKLMVANLLEPNVTSKIDPTAMDSINPKWRNQNTIKR